MTRVSIISYRKLSFAKKFGYTVRDLMILKEIERNSSVEQVHWFERPSLPHEMLIDSLSGRNTLSAKTVMHKKIDLNMFSALKMRRLRSERSFSKHWPDLNEVTRSHENSIILDFHPFAIPPIEVIRKSYYWYDLIDNFSKHNRFSDAEKRAVDRKYEFVAKNANLITGVSKDAVSQFGGKVLPNKLIEDDFKEANASPAYDIGFLGFITDKFDIEFISRLACHGLKIGIYGHAYDKNTLSRIRNIPNVTYGGPFNSKHANSIIAKFKIGAIPYIPALSHDESPIKFSQYVASGRPVILSKSFDPLEEMYGENVHYYDHSSIEKTLDFVSRVSSSFDEVTSEVKRISRNGGSVFWKSDIQDIISNIKF